VRNRLRGTRGLGRRRCSLFLVRRRLKRKERTHSSGSLSSTDQSLKVVVPIDPVVVTAAQAAALETDVRNRRGTHRCDRASRSAPCRRVPRGHPASRGFRTGSPSGACWCAQKQRRSLRSSRRFAIQPPGSGQPARNGGRHKVLQGGRKENASAGAQSVTDQLRL
jgi:hypothetical protein